MNRFDQLSQTLVENLTANKKYQQQIEFVLVNFINAEESIKTDKWIRKNFRNEIKSNYLRYFITDKMQYFHMSVAKNTTHQNATGEFLINLDGDNFILPEEVQYLLSNKKLLHSLVHFFNGKYHQGTHGKVGLSSDDFNKIGGYNESFRPRMYEDDDLIHRYLIFYKNTIGKNFYATNKTQFNAYYTIRLKIKFSVFSDTIFRLTKLFLKLVGRDKLRLLKDYPKQKTPLDNSDKEKMKNLSPIDIDANKKENYIISNRRIGKKLTSNYSQNLVQEKIGVTVIRIDENNIDDYFLSV